MKKLKKISKNNLAQAKHMKIMDKLEIQAQLGFQFVMNSLIKEIKATLKEDKLAKSDDFTQLPSGWTGEVPTINIDLGEILDVALAKHMKALEWVMLGGIADKEALKAAKEIGLTKIMTPGIAPSAYLQSLDTHREHHLDVTGEVAPEVAKDVIKITFDQIKNRCVRVTESFGSNIKNQVLEALEQTVNQKNFDNLNIAHKKAIDSIPVSGGEEAVSTAISKLSDTLKIKDVVAALEMVTEKGTSDWSRTVKTETAMSSAVGTHQAILEIYGNENDDVTVIIEGFYDQKICDFCLDASKKPDGSFKKYKIGDFKASGYNFRRKKSEWELAIPPFHHHCRCSLIYVPRGFTVDNDGNFIPKTKT